MTTSTHRETTIEADPNLPTVRVVREFDASPDKVYRAHVEPDLVARWMGPRDLEMRIDEWDARRGGSYRYAAVQDGKEVAAFYGSFHEARPGERLVQTFTWEGAPDGVSLDTMTFHDLGGGRTRVEILSVVDTMEARDAMVASGMESGIVEGFEKLDELLAE
jgi:uncharacterized protein YndB with AHSA1/START domain